MNKQKNKKISNKLYIILDNISGGYDLVCYDKGIVKNIIDVSEQVNTIVKRESKKYVTHAFKELDMIKNDFIENGGINKWQKEN